MPHVYLNLIGDIALNGLLIQEQQHNSRRFKEISNIFNDLSFSIANLELPVKGKDGDKNPNKNIYFYTRPDVVKEVLPLLKIKLVSLANNHICDYGVSGVQNTINTLDELTIQQDRKSTRLNSSHTDISRMPSSA